MMAEVKKEIHEDKRLLSMKITKASDSVNLKPTTSICV